MYKDTDDRGQLKLAIAHTLLPNTPPLPMGEYDIIVADPPWKYELRETDSTHRGRTPYPNMTNDKILAMNVGGLTNRSAYLFLWVTNNHLELGFECIRKWGFNHKSIHTWVKTSKAHTDDDPRVHIGIGNYGRNCTEHILVASTGKAPSFTALGICDIPNVIFAPRGEHSAKPQEFYDRVQRVQQAMGGRVIELFAREKRFADWHVWGAEAKQETELEKSLRECDERLRASQP